MKNGRIHSLIGKRKPPAQAGDFVIGNEDQGSRSNGTIKSFHFNPKIFTAISAFIAVFGVYTIFFSQAAVVPTQITFENGNTSACSGGVNTTSGNSSFLTTTAKSYEGSYSAEAKYTGGGQNAYARCVVTTSWNTGDEVWYGGAFFLPTGFASSMQNQVDLMRWDNFSLNNTSQDWGGLIIQNSDKQARLKRFNVSNDFVDLSTPFSFPENRWVWVEMRQKLSPTNGQAINEVWIDGTLQSSSTTANTYGREITRIRYGLVAIGEGSQTNPLNLWVDRATVSTSKLGPVGGSPLGPTANLWVDTNGGSCTRQTTAGTYNDGAACGSLQAAFAASSGGDSVRIVGGTYPSQSVTGSKTSLVTMIVDTGTMNLNGGLSVSASNVSIKGPGIASNMSVGNGNSTPASTNITIDGWVFDQKGGENAAGYVSSVNGATIKNSTFMNNLNESMVFTDAGPGGGMQNVEWNNNVFHDALTNAAGVSAGVHTECVYGGGGTNIQFRNNKFYNCRTMDLFVTTAKADTIMPVNYTIENNIFDCSLQPDGSCHAYGLVFVDGWNSLNGAMVRNNWFAQDVSLPSTATGSTSYFYSNAIKGVLDCNPSSSLVVRAYNITTGPACTGTGNKSVSSLMTDTAFKPTAGSPLVNAGDPSNSTATDKDGVARVGLPDAGPYEYTSGGGTDTTPPDTTITTSTPANGASTTATTASISFSGTDNIGVTSFECSLDSTTTYSTCTSPKSYPGLTTGSHTIRVRAKDAAGNTDASPASITFTITSTSTCSTKQGDANNDQAVNILDISAILTNYGQTSTTNCADVTKDSSINIQDISLVLSKYGT